MRSTYITFLHVLIGLAVEEAAALIKTYNTFISRVEELDLPAVVEAQPIINASICSFHINPPLTRDLMQGRELARILDTKPGPWTGQVLSRVIEWQLNCPSGTKEECEEWLKGEHAAGKISLQVPSARQAQANRGTKRTR